MTPLQAVAAKVQEPKPSADMYMEVVGALLQAGADPGVLISVAKEETLLHSAVARRQLALVRALAKAGADVNTPTKVGPQARGRNGACALGCDCCVSCDVAFMCECTERQRDGAAALRRP